MDFVLVQFYRVVYDELTLLYDVLDYTVSRQPQGKTLNILRESLESILIQEFKESSGYQQHPRSKKHSSKETRRPNSSATEDRVYFAVTFLRDVLVEFIVEELSQFPFWTYKIRRVILEEVSATPPVLLVELWNDGYRNALHYQDIFQSCIQYISFNFRGCIPLIIAAGIRDISYLGRSCKKFFISYFKEESSSSFLNGENSSLDSFTLGGSPKKPAHVSNTSIAEGSLSTPPTQSWGIFGRVLIEVLAYPFLSLSLKAVANPNSEQQPLMSVIQSLSHFKALFRGLRSSLLLAMIPLTPIVYFGIPEYLIYNLILKHELSESISDVLMQLLSTNGVTGLFRYGIASLNCLIPGFISFSCARFVYCTIFGTSLVRKIQKRRRFQILNNYFEAKQKDRTGTDIMKRMI